MRHVSDFSAADSDGCIRLSETDLTCAGVLLTMWAAQHNLSVAEERALFQQTIDRIERIAREAGRVAWGDVVFRGDSPTPEEYIAYKLTLLGQWFDEMNASPYCPVPLFSEPE
ncbi:MAG TPA: hypothetical protein IAA32_05930 [Candidatus Butyricicoccus stercorigallinarum]|nr:hypothetical protein [Candidatus Butyricicoccus stercorigallinarum]